MSTNDAETVATLMNLFQRFDPLSNLNDANLSQLAKGASSFKLSKRQHLVAADEHRWLVYLVAGNLQGKDTAGEVFTIRPSRTGQAALFDAVPRPVDVTVLDDAQFLRVDRKQFSVLMNEQISSSTLVEEIHLEGDDEGLFDTLIQSYQSGALKLPLREEVITTVVPLLANDGGGTDNVLLDMMRAEPALALVIANITGTSSQVRTGELSSLRQLVDNVDRSQLAAELSQWGRDNPFPEAGTPMYQRIVTAYDYLRRVGAFSRGIAKELGSVDADLAEYAGICSKVGLVSSWLMCHEAGSDVGDESSATLDQLAPLVTEMLLGQMRVDNLVTECVEASNAEAFQAQGDIDVSDVVRVAVTYLPMDILGQPVSLVEDENLMEMFRKNGIGLRELDVIMEKCNLDAGSSLRMAG